MRPSQTIRLIAETPALTAALTEQFATLPEFGFETDKAARCDISMIETDGALCLLRGAVEIGRLAQPFRFVDLAVLLRQAAPAEAPVKIGRLNFDRTARVLAQANGDNVRLTEKEAALLAMLADASAEGVSREDLLHGVWGYRAGMDTHTLETHIYRLRRKIEQDALAPQIVVTTAAGYRLAIDLFVDCGGPRGA